MLTVENVTQAVKDWADMVTAQKEALSLLDTPIGDGDHGTNLSRGLAAAVAVLDEKASPDVATVFKTVAMTLITQVGGASGPLYGTAFLEMAKAAMATTEAVPVLEAGLAGIEKRGQSEPGQKTMIDVWAPLVERLASGESVEGAVPQTFADATKDILATKGRASYLGERSIGHVDPGAQSSAYFFEALQRAGVVA